MIHQFIFAAPRPGMTEQAFQEYWVNVHAVQYAGKIKQIRQYVVDTRVDTPWDDGEPTFGGIAEIWLRPDEQVASLQSPEFLEGARLDEPRWAAFWQTLGLDTDPNVIVPGDERPASGGWVKSVTLLKRRPGMGLEEFRQYALTVHAPRVADNHPGLGRYLHCQSVDGAYGLGEARFDAIDVCCYENVDALVEATGRHRYYAGPVMDRLADFVDLTHLFQMYARENWIIGPNRADDKEVQHGH